MYTYTLIIPHKNSTNLLRRCIDSIPQREDLHVIIVDDNSDPAIVDFDNFPALNRDNTTIIFNKDGLGAGHARNVGLDHVVNTKWVFFADADDFFTPELSGKLDQYKDSDADMIFFKLNSVISETMESADRLQINNVRADIAASTGEYDLIRYKINTPYCKFIAYKNIKANNIRYDEVRYSNDVMFGIKIGELSHNIVVDSSVIYTVTVCENSLVRIIKKESVECRYNVAVEAIKYLTTINKEYYHPNLFAYCYKFFKINIWMTIKYFVKSLFYTPAKYWCSDIMQCVVYLFKPTPLN